MLVLNSLKAEELMGESPRACEYMRAAFVSTLRHHIPPTHLDTHVHRYIYIYIPVLRTRP